MPYSLSGGSFLFIPLALQRDTRFFRCMFTIILIFQPPTTKAPIYIQQTTTAKYVAPPSIQTQSYVQSTVSYLKDVRLLFLSSKSLLSSATTDAVRSFGAIRGGSNKYRRQRCGACRTSVRQSSCRCFRYRTTIGPLLIIALRLVSMVELDVVYR